MKLTIKSNTMLLIIMAMAIFPAMAQKSKPKTDRVITIPMEPGYWEYDTASTKFITHRNVKAAHGMRGTRMCLKNQRFANGTLEYDVELESNAGFPGIGFRMSDDRKNGDYFYIRYFGTISPESRNTLQYTAHIDGMGLWDITDEYQAGARLVIPGWNHVKLVISGKQMRAYVNDMSRPALLVPELEGGNADGVIFFEGGPVTIANVVLRPDAVEDLPPTPGYHPTYNDTRYLRHWQVTEATDFPFGKEVVHQFPYMSGTPVKSELPDSTAKWTPVTTNSRDIINLTSLFGGVKDNMRRIAWLKTTLQSDRDQEVSLKLGFSDEIWLFINGQLLYVDKNQYTAPIVKLPRGRCTIENATIRLPLKQGKNEILVGLTNYFYGWGLIARLDDTNGIHLPEGKR